MINWLKHQWYKLIYPNRYILPGDIICINDSDKFVVVKKAKNDIITIREI